MSVHYNSLLWFVSAPNDTAQMANPPISKEQREREGAILKAVFLRRKAETRLTQIELCNAIDLNPGLLQRFFTGEKQIPLETLIDLAKELKISPAAIRPDIESLSDRILRATGKGALADLLYALDDSSRAEVIRFIEFTKARKL